MKRRFQSPQEVAEQFGLSSQTIRNYARAGLFPGAVRPLRGSHWLIPTDAVDAFGKPSEQPLARSSRARGRGRAA